ncbi:hypothetical protein RR46_09339 [Papilio xuthus]|uniref:Cuticular protein n=1 Tax=Papilio xuthus TaxID=66420 RepID=A0A194PVT0_PAPXU|nr:hypothetical protein RR46_09339 [Papilio xuthus]
MMKFVVLSCLVACAMASAYAPGLAYSAYGAYPYAYGAYNGAYGFAPLAYSGAYLQPSNYRGPLSLAPGQPADTLGADGRPLDTLEVNLDRSAHITAKALDSGLHLLKKRSVVAPAVVAPIAAPIAPVATSLITPATPITYAAPIAPAAVAYGPTYTHYL